MYALLRPRFDPESLLRSLMENVPGAIYRCANDEDWTMLGIGDDIERISGYPATDFIASSVRSFSSIIHPDDCVRVHEEVDAAVADGRSFSLEYRVQRADGELRWILDRGVLTVDRQGDAWLDGIIFDITERRSAKELLRTARLRAGEDRELGELLDRGQEELQTSLAELRELARGIHPAVLTDRGLEPALHALVARVPVPVTLEAADAEHLPGAVESAAYFVVSEALTNVAKYAGAGRAEVTVRRRNAHVCVEVADDGVGGADPAQGSGLRGLADRVAALDGTLTVDSPPGGGTRLRAEIPVTVSRLAGPSASPA